ncbi:MAG: SIS domain-containing protein [Acidobacteriota bacterium]
MLDTFLADYLKAAATVTADLPRERIAEAVRHLAAARDDGHTVFVAGNGGSATVASNLVVDLVKCGSFGKSKRFRAVNLADSVATTTAFANDEGYDTVFAEPLRNFAAAGDVLVVISGSGNSPNVLRAVDVARELGCTVIAMTSGEQGQLRGLADVPLLVPSRHMGRLEDAFFVLSHTLAYPFIEDVPGL